MTFLVQDGSVWIAGAKPVRLSDAAVDQLLDCFEQESAVEVFNDLYEAQREAMGEDFIPRCTHLRLVSNNTAKDVVRHQLRASCADIESAIAQQQLEQPL
jgi:hypothetical protein